MEILEIGSDMTELWNLIDKTCSIVLPSCIYHLLTKLNIVEEEQVMVFLFRNTAEQQIYLVYCTCVLT